MILDDIIARKRQDLLTMPAFSGALRLSQRDFRQALQQKSRAIIAECKARSPSEGVICSDYDLPTIVRDYVAGGAAALSVLTDAPYFGGSLADLATVRGLCDLPLLCKDFVVDSKQVDLARGHGADAVLLIMRVLTLPEATALKKQVESLGMTAVLEIFDEQDLGKALALDPEVILVNHRNLADFSVNRDKDNLLAKIPASVTVIAASGITAPEQVQALPARANAVLIGTALMRAIDRVHFLERCHPAV